MRTEPEISIVIPTRGRPDSLARTLAALDAQDVHPGTFEVIVSIDGPAEGSRPTPDQAHHPYPLHLLEAADSRGAAAARNRGAALARGTRLVFLDDDIEVVPGFVDAHLKAHREGLSIAVGYLPPVAARATGFFAVALRGWWEAMFGEMRRVGHRYTFKDLLTGNCSMPAELFRRLRGFDERYRCHEDYEFGVRALQAGADIRFLPDARGYHHEITTLARSLARKEDEGRADVQMVSHHPHLVAVLPLAPGYPAPRLQRLLRRAAFDFPRLGALIAWLVAATLPVWEGGRFRGRWRRAVNALLTAAYWRGIASAVGTREAFDALIGRAAATPAPACTTRHLDLSRGLAAAMETLDRERPHGATIGYGPYKVGELPAVPGAERLRGVHLQAALAEPLAFPLLRALGRARVVSVRVDGPTLVATGPLPNAPLRL